MGLAGERLYFLMGQKQQEGQRIHYSGKTKLIAAIT